MTPDPNGGILHADSQRAIVLEQAGGKGCGLYDLSARGVPVPPWAVVRVDVFRRFRSETGLDSLVARELDGLVATPREERAVAAVAGRISRAVLNSEQTPELNASIAAAYSVAGEGSVAVRSSAIGEDGGQFSFAGQHRTVLNAVGMAAVGEAVQACWASAWSVEAIHYRLMNDLPLESIEMAIIIQELVAADKSGIAFTANPATGSLGEYVVSAAYGLGEMVVSGAIDADTVVIERDGGDVREEIIGAKEMRLDPLLAGGCRTSDVPDDQRSVPALSADELRELHRHAVDLTRLMGDDRLDIEWAFVDGKLWTLQCRPITGASPSPVASKRNFRVWDNSNIIESYGEIVAPLTYTFARYAYARVYREHCELLGVPRRHLKEIEEWLPQLLGYFDGRVYYNLLNWYRLIRLIPLYSANRRVLEISMGIESLDEDIAARQIPFAFRTRREAAWVRSVIGIRFAWYFSTIHRQVDKFVEHFYGVYDELNVADYSDCSADEIYENFVDMDRRIMMRAGRMTLLEASTGLSFAGLYALTKRWLPEAPDWFLYEAVRTSPNVESVQPLHRMDEIAEFVVAHSVPHEMVRSLSADRLDDALRRAEESSCRDLVALVDAYLDEFGYRNANELKLEEPDLREDPSAFFELLKSAIRQLGAEDATSGRDGSAADRYLSNHLRGWRRGVYEMARRRVQRCLAARERVRFCRTRIFGLSRLMFRAMGADMTRVGALEMAEDIFYLRLEEVRGCFEGSIEHRELKPLVALRKEEAAANADRDAAPRFVTEGGIYWGASADAWSETAAGSEAAIDGRLQGTPCSPGVVHGEARVMERPEDAQGGVLVTYRTDPGWVSVLRSASALLIERGSPLTHVAIVARELEIPTVVQISGLTRRVHSGMNVTVDGSTGTIELAQDEEDR